ncbi:MAG: M20 family metallopeptidase [Actinomycetales bacterium]
MRTQAIADRIGPDLVALRRSLHQTPELGNDLPVTQAQVLNALAGLDLEVTRGTALSSVVAVLRGSGDGPPVLLRADMDALPVTEQVAVPYASQSPGLMHACGHDLHVAALVGAARILTELRSELRGDVVFMFQPGEEAPGGAEPMLAEGLLDASGRRVEAAYALHVVSSGDPRGVWWGRPGPMFAACDQLNVRVVGEGGHGSVPFRAKDPIPVACEIVLALQAMVTRQFDVFDPVVVTVGTITSGTKENIIPAYADFRATVRSFTPEARARLESRSRQVVEGVAAAHGMTAEAEYVLGYPSTVNDDGEYAFVAEVIKKMYGVERYRERAHPDPGGEDMSFVLEQVPGAYVMISACREGVDPDTAPDNHSPLADFDDAVLPDCAPLLAELALRRTAR